MSVDSYFCFCCLSTSDLSSLVGHENEDNYVRMLKELFALKPSQDYEDDSHICAGCTERLKDALSFKTQVFATINILQVNGLVTLNKINGELFITRVSSSSSDDETKTEVKGDINIIPVKEHSKQGKINLHLKIDNFEATGRSEQQSSSEKKPKKLKGLTPEQSDNSIKLENDVKKLETVEIIEGADIIRPVIEESIKASERFICTSKKKKNDCLQMTPDSKCPICSESFPNMYVFNIHMNGHFPNHICEVCGKGYITQKRLRRHLTSHDRGPFNCDGCDSVFTNHSTYYAHRQRAHTSVRQYACPHCALRFRTFARRAAHLVAAHGMPADTYSCTVCRKAFLHSGNLSQHMRSQHQRVKRHFCQECDAAFYHRQDLLGHAATHTGLNMFPCTVCAKSFPRKKSLKVHMLTHTDDKPFCCGTCGKKFAQKCALLAHLKTYIKKQKNKDKVIARKSKAVQSARKTAKLHNSTTEVNKSTAKVNKSTAKVNKSTAKVNGATTKVTNSTAKVTDAVTKEFEITIKEAEFVENMLAEAIDIQKDTVTVDSVERNDSQMEFDIPEPEKALYNCYKLF